MKNKRNVVWGLTLITVAVTIVFSFMGYLGSISVYSILLAGLFIALIITGFMSRSFSQIIFSLAFLGIIFDKQLGIENLTPWPILAVALLLVVGLRLLFPRKKKEYFSVNYDWDKKHKHNNGGKGHFEFVEEEGFYNIESAMKSETRYIDCDNFTGADIDNAMGNLSIYLDKATMKNESAAINIDNAMGSASIYVPKKWKVVESGDHIFGNVRYHGKSENETNTLYLNIDTSFGNIEIYYI